MFIYIIRHGQTLWNKDLRWQGQTDVELDETGYRQSENVAARLVGCGITALYSSPLKRARATAEAIGEVLSLKPLFRDDLKEIALGTWEGLALREVREKHAEQLRIWEEEPDNDPGDGIESYSHLRRRAVDAVRDICRGHGQNDTIAIVTHGAWIRAFLIYVMRIPENERLGFELNNTGISIVRYDTEKNRFRVTTLNEHWHVSRDAEPAKYE